MPIAQMLQFLSNSFSFFLWIKFVIIPEFFPGFFKDKGEKRFHHGCYDSVKNWQEIVKDLQFTVTKA
jgi:hypothetical protein